MIRYLFDTDTFTLYLRHHSAVFARVLHEMPKGIGLPLHVVEEIWNGWQPVIRKAKSPEDTAAAYQRLADTLLELRNWLILPPSAETIRTYQQLKKAKLNVNASDLKIAATALTLGAILVTGNTRDFRRVDRLILEDWSQRAS